MKYLFIIVLFCCSCMSSRPLYYQTEAEHVELKKQQEQKKVQTILICIGVIFYVVVFQKYEK